MAQQNSSARPLEPQGTPGPRTQTTTSFPSVVGVARLLSVDPCYQRWTVLCVSLVSQQHAAQHRQQAARQKK